MSNRYATQAACLAELCKRRARTNRELLDVGISNSPWRRLAEWLDRHPDWVRQTNTFKRVSKGKTLVTWRIVKARK